MSNGGAAPHSRFTAAVTQSSTLIHSIIRVVEPLISACSPRSLVAAVGGKTPSRLLIPPLERQSTVVTLRQTERVSIRYI